MAEPRSDEASAAAERMPRWVKVFAAIALVLAVGVVILLIAGGGGHGPGRHGASDRSTPPAASSEHALPA